MKLTVFRIAKQQHLNDLSGEGARLFGGRWNKRGTHMLYTSESLSLSVLELLVHADYQFIPQDFGYLQLEISDTTIISQVKPAILKQNWRHNPPLSFTQDYGSKWISSNKNLVLKVPSAVLPMTFNYLINPMHPDFESVKVIKKGVLELDSRIVK